MKIKDFINYRRKCPLCDGNLATQFISNRKQYVKLDDEYLQITLHMDAISVYGTNYAVSFNFHLQNNTIRIEFYNNDNKTHFINYVPISLIKQFREFIKNITLGLNTYHFIRECDSCGNYNYNSTSFDIQSLYLYDEHITIEKEWIDLSRVKLGLVLCNNYLLQRSYVFTETSNPHLRVQVPLIMLPDMASEQLNNCLIEKLNLIITFS